jgi:peptidoglycan/xylan/chitin deacetylase (PgdA/CDA1 family)
MIQLVVISVSLLLSSATIFAHSQKGSTSPDHIYHEVGLSEVDPDPQTNLSPFCDFDEDGTIDLADMYGKPIDSQYNEMTPENAQIMISKCTQLRQAQADLAGNGTFADEPITPGKLNLKSGELALTVDDGPTKGVTEKVLKVLAKYNVKATFFVVGNRILPNSSLIRKMILEGHIIGNHTYNHLVSTDPTKVTSEIIKGHQAFFAFLRSPEGKGVMIDSEGQSRFANILFRAPGLAWKKAVNLNLNNDSLTKNLIGPMHASIGTDAPNADWSCWSKKVTPEACARAYYKDIITKGRGIILSHDINKKTPEMLDYLLSMLHNQGGGIRNAGGAGAWTFVRMDNREELKGLHSVTHDEFIKSLSEAQN